MGSSSLAFASVPPLASAIFFTDTIKQNAMGTVRMNYTFGGPVVAKY